MTRLDARSLLLGEADVSVGPVVIAEVADAHYGDFGRAKEMVHAAKASGADVIKFQHHLPAEEMLPEIPQSSNMREPLWDFLQRNSLTLDQHVQLAALCSEIGIIYACTPFSARAALELEGAIGPRFYKIGSGEMLDFPTLGLIAEFGKPMVVSTGMSTVDEVDELYRFLKPKVETLALMNCTSAYPASPSEIHLSFVAEMHARYPGVIVGHSEHTKSNHFSLSAVALGATVIERHVTIDSALEGPDSDVSLTFDELEEFICLAREISVALEVPKRVQPGEEEIRSWAHRSLVFLRDLPPGHVLQPGDIWGKRPGTGVPARFREHYVGRQLSRPVHENTLVSDEDFFE